MSLPVRIATLAAAFAAVAAGTAFIVIHYLLGGLPVESFGSGVRPDTGAQVNIVMQEDPQNTVTSKPDWVSYFIKSPDTGHHLAHVPQRRAPTAARGRRRLAGWF
jgi:hypothetical protein